MSVSSSLGSAASQMPLNDAETRQLWRNRALIRWWLYGICLLVLAMVVVGGATRLTESGLSITEWKPIHGAIPPLSVEEWEEEFAKYREIPQYEAINKGMTLDEFKFIFWWEWGHRLLGRFIGVAFFVPMAVFWIQGRIEPWLKPKLVIGLILGGLQGALGWYMVASGLVDRIDVSQYRLAAHLTLACVIFAYLFWIARRLVPREAATAEEAEGLNRIGQIFLWLVFLQIFMGGLVAGLNAGFTFNTWPLMDGQVIPRGLLVMDPAWANFFENVMTVQFQHRMTAYVLVAVAVLLVIRSKKVSGRKPVMMPARHIAGFVLLQVIFGIATLVMNVPLHLALWHQAFAVIVLGAAVDYLAALKGPYPVRR
ncbi:COX15/CtaA family protein [Roseibium sp.]|uniref:COX15/CtaA family protein n=1 Tax=Roseibium sp. TaxID=1936156 RepID=UPI003A97C5C1